MAASEAPSCPTSRLRSATFSDATRMKPPARLGCSPRVGRRASAVRPAPMRRDGRMAERPFTFECAACGKQTSVTAGTIMHGSKLPLTAWFWAACLMATHSNGISALQLRNQLGLGSYKSAWLLGAELRRAMVAPGRSPLAGLAEVDETEIPLRTKDDPVAGGGGRSHQGKMLVAFSSPPGYGTDHEHVEEAGGVEAWRGIAFSFRKGSARRASMNFTEARIGAGRLCFAGGWPRGFVCPGCGRRLGVTQNTAWKLNHKLMQVIEGAGCGQTPDRSGRDRRCLSRWRTLPVANAAAARPARRRSLSPCETTPEGQPVRLKLRRVNGFRRKEVEEAARRSLDPPSTVVSDGLACFRGVADAGCTHQPIRTGSEPHGGADTRLQVGQHRARQHQDRHHRHLPGHPPETHPSLPGRIRLPLQSALDLAAMMPRLGWAAVRTPPMPYRLLKLAEAHA